MISEERRSTSISSSYIVPALLAVFDVDGEEVAYKTEGLSPLWDHNLTTLSGRWIFEVRPDRSEWRVMGPDPRRPDGTFRHVVEAFPVRVEITSIVLSEATLLEEFGAASNDWADHAQVAHVPTAPMLPPATTEGHPPDDDDRSQEFELRFSKAYHDIMRDNEAVESQPQEPDLTPAEALALLRRDDEDNSKDGES